MGLDSRFIDGFAWPVPRAFAPAVSTCRFEQGDVLYSDRIAYDRWSEAQRGICRIQVFEPARSGRPVGGGRGFSANWQSPVELELTCESDDLRRRHTTSQGHLFTCLWRGDASHLDPDCDAPDPPALQRELHGRLEESLPAFRRHLGRRARSGSRCLYISVVDQASDDSRAKARAIEAALGESLSLSVHDLPPGRAGLDGAERFHPSLLLRALVIESADGERVAALLKGALYTPPATGGGTDRFSLSRHGLLAL